MAWALNGVMLPIPNGAPLRLRVERMLGYKHAKFVERIEAVASLDGVGGGRGGYWEDVADYEWYAGI
jgi:DMSO/TMAO reductase YedYZ molybdopterin-dependent catalytic subunit